ARAAAASGFTPYTLYTLHVTLSDTSHFIPDDGHPGVIRAVPHVDEVLHLRRRHRRGDEVALQRIAADLIQEFELRRRLYAFGTRGQRKIVRELRDGTNVCGCGLARRDVRDQRPVDLHFAEGHVVALRQRRHPDTEIVER